LAVRGLTAFSLLRIGNCLMHFNGEKLDVREVVPAVKAMTQKIHIKLSA
jgi:hypothetical protein